jgi:hypothetical protein
MKNMGMLQDLLNIYATDGNAFATVKAVCAAIDVDRGITRARAGAIQPNGYAPDQYDIGAEYNTYGDAYFKLICKSPEDGQNYRHKIETDKAHFADQLQAFTEDNFTGGDHFIKAIRNPDGWGMRLKTCYNGGAATTNDVSVGYADSAGGATYANQIHVPGVIMWEGIDLYNAVNAKINRSGDTVTGVLNVPTPTLPS